MPDVLEYASPPTTRPWSIALPISWGLLLVSIACTFFTWHEYGFGGGGDIGISWMIGIAWAAAFGIAAMICGVIGMRWSRHRHARRISGATSVLTLLYLAWIIPLGLS